VIKKNLAQKEKERRQTRIDKRSKHQNEKKTIRKDENEGNQNQL
jgi:hypothetical protein